MGPYVLLHAALVGVFAVAALHSLYFWSFSRRDSVMLAFAIHGFVCAIFALTIVALTTAATVPAIQSALNLRATVGLLGQISVTWLLSLVTGVRSRAFFGVIAAIVLPLAAINQWVFPFTGFVTGLDRVSLPWGEVISIARHAPPGWWTIPAYAPVLAVPIFALVAAAGMRRRDPSGAFVVALAVGGSFLTNSVAILVDFFHFRLPYIGLIPHTIFVGLISMLVFREFHRRRERLAASESRFRSIFDQNFQFTGLMHIDGTLLEVNRTALLFAGVRDADVIGKPIWETPWWNHSPELQDRLKGAIQLAAGGKTVRFEATHPNPDGGMAHVDFSLKPVRNDFGAITLLLPEAREITERKKAEQALAESEMFLRMAQEAGHVGSWEWDIQTNRVRWSEEMARIHGIRLDEFDGMLEMAASFFHPDDRMQFEFVVKEILAGSNFQSHEYRIVRSDGSIRNLWPVGQVFRDDAGEVSKAAGIVIDVTELKQAEAALHRSEDRYRLLIEHARIVIWEADPETFTFTYVSEFAEKLLGFPQSRWYESGFWADRIHPDDRATAVAFCINATKAKQDHHFEYRMVRADGTSVWISDTVRIEASADRVVSLRGVLTDITERVTADTTKRTLEAQLAQSQKMEAIGQLAGGIAHDFNNLLTVINGYSELLLAKMPPGDRQRAMIEDIRLAGERAASLTRQLLAFSRRQILEPRVLDLNSAVVETKNILIRLIGADVRLETVLEPQLHPVKVDPGQITQVIMNLAVNARDAMPDGGTLTIETSNVDVDAAFAANHVGAGAGRYVLLALRDTGIGMTPEIKARLFEPFFTTKGIGKGTGLGLAVVHGIVQQSHGFVDVSSELNVGTTFRIYLPAVGPVSGTDSQIGPADSVRGGEKILLVEDDAGVREMAVAALESFGYCVRKASGFPEVFHQMSAVDFRIDLLVTDVVMPEMNGGKIAEILRAQFPGLRTVFLSGYPETDAMRNGIPPSDAAFLQKPFTPVALAQKVREVLDRPR